MRSMGTLKYHPPGVQSFGVARQGSPVPSEARRAQISFVGSQTLYRAIRVATCSKMAYRWGARYDFHVLELVCVEERSRNSFANSVGEELAERECMETMGSAVDILDEPESLDSFSWVVIHFSYSTFVADEQCRTSPRRCCHSQSSRNDV